MNKFLVGVVGTLEFAGRHYKENLALYEQFDSMTDEILSILSDMERDEWISVREKFQQHDAECPFKSNTFRSELDETLA